MVKAFVVPMLTILGGVVLGLLVLGPIATFARNLLGALMGFLFEINSTICGFLYGALIQVCVMFGVHWGFVAPVSYTHLDVYKRQVRDGRKDPDYAYGI